MAKDIEPAVRAAALSNPKYIERTEKESLNVGWNEKDILANITVKEKILNFSGGFLFWLVLVLVAILGVKIFQVDLSQSLSSFTF